jgi:hypothetical protein
MIPMMKMMTMAMTTQLLHPTTDTSKTKEIYTKSKRTTIHHCPHVSNGPAPSRTFYLSHFLLILQ